MKISIAIAFSLSLFTTSVAVLAANEVDTPVLMLPGKNRNVMVLKIKKSWQGAHVEVLALNGDCVCCQTIGRRRMIVDFSKVEAGSYRVKVTKDDQVEEFTYLKR